MAATRSRPPWFGNVGVQVLAGIALAYNLVQVVLHLIDARWADAFLSFAWCVVFGYVLEESLTARKEQRQRAAAGDDTPAD
jgi:hypothetical protein